MIYTSPTCEGVAYFDGGGQAPGPTVAAAHVEGPGIAPIEECARYPGGTHNTAEWNALILALRLGLRQGVTHLTVRGDSMLVIRQAGGDYRVKAPALKPLHAEAMRLAAEFEHVAFEWVPREENTRADELGRR
jgi:ribonuclease H / adenosylcobalamin/alpha-ribazole phosphatase